MNININSISELLKICKNVGCSVKNKNDLRSVKKELITFLKNREQKGGAHGLCEVPHAVEVTPDYPTTYRITDQFHGRLARLAPGKYNLVKANYVMGDSMHMKDRIEKVQALYLLQMISLFHYDIFHLNKSKQEIKELIRNCKYAHITVNEILDMVTNPNLFANSDEAKAFNKFKMEKGAKLIGPDYNFKEFAVLEYDSAAPHDVQHLFTGGTQIPINRTGGGNYLDVGASHICYNEDAQQQDGSGDHTVSIGYNGTGGNHIHSNLATAIIKNAEEKIKKLLTDDPGLRVFYIGILHELGSRENNGVIQPPIQTLNGNHTEMYAQLTSAANAAAPLVPNKYDNLSKFCNFLSGDPN